MPLDLHPIVRLPSMTPKYEIICSVPSPAAFEIINAVVSAVIQARFPDTPVRHQQIDGASTNYFPYREWFIQLFVLTGLDDDMHIRLYVINPPGNLDDAQLDAAGEDGITMLLTALHSALAQALGSTILSNTAEPLLLHEKQHS